MDEVPGGVAGAVALVTGAGSGLGRAFAVGLAEAGASVAVAGRTPERLEATVRAIADLGGVGCAVRADVTDDGEVAAAVREVERRLGAVTLLVNNAGAMAPVGPDWEVSPEDWWRTFEVNVRGAYRCVRAVLPGMIARGHGRIINVSSSAAHNLQPYTSAYGASKAALSYWSAALARAVAAHGIKVFAYAPGMVRTAMTEGLATAPEARRWLGEGIRRVLEQGRDTPMSRAVEVLVQLASGDLDALSGRHLDARDDLEALVRQVAEGPDPPGG